MSKPVVGGKPGGRMESIFLWKHHCHHLHRHCHCHCHQYHRHQCHHHLHNFHITFQRHECHHHLTCALQGGQEGAPTGRGWDPSQTFRLFVFFINQSFIPVRFIKMVMMMIWPEGTWHHRCVERRPHKRFRHLGERTGWRHPAWNLDFWISVFYLMNLEKLKLEVDSRSN